MLSAIIITKNEEQMITDCLISVQFADEIIVVDTGNTDGTNKIASTYKTKIVKSSGKDWSQFRNDGLKAAKGDWILYVDADERVTPQMRQEIDKELSFDVYEVPRKNIYLGREMKYGGWGGEHIIRLFKRSALQGYEHALHEQPVFSGKVGRLKNGLIHFSHRDLTSMLQKTYQFTEYEAKLRIAAKHPPVVAWRIVRVMVTEFRTRFVKYQAWRDGVEGTIDGMFQVFNMFVIYARVWEMQHETGNNS